MLGGSFRTSVLLFRASQTVMYNYDGKRAVQRTEFSGQELVSDNKEREFTENEGVLDTTTVFGTCLQIEKIEIEKLKLSCLEIVISFNLSSIL